VKKLLTLAVVIAGFLGFAGTVAAQSLSIADLMTQYRSQLATVSAQMNEQAEGTVGDFSAMDMSSVAQRKIYEQELQIRELESKLGALEEALKKRLEEEVQSEERDRQAEGISGTGVYKERSEEWRERVGLDERDAAQLTDARMIELSESLRMPRSLRHPALSRVTRKIFERMIQNRIDVLTESKLAPFGHSFFTQGSDMRATVQEKAVPPDYRLGPGDSLKIMLWSDIGEEAPTDVVVDAEGQVFIPTLGLMRIQGMTLGEFESSIMNSLSGKYKGFRGQVSLRRVRSMQVFVIGEVAKPGALITSALSTAFNALYRAGGPLERGSMRDIKVIRDNQVVAHIDLYRYFLNGDRTQDVPLEVGDTILVPLLKKRVFVKGQVRRPAIYELIGEKTLHEVLEMAGGLDAAAYTPRINIRRWQGDQRRVMMDVKTDSATYHSFIVEDGDEIEIEKTLEKVANLINIDGAVQKPGEYAVGEKTRLSEMITRAGGLIPEEADRQAGQIIRKTSPGRERIVSFNPGKVMSNDPEHDLILEPMDRIRIFSAREVVPEQRIVKIAGAVRRPGEYIVRDGMTLRDVVLRAMGLTDEASGDAELARIQMGTETTITRVDLLKIMKNAGDPDNARVFANDQITVLARGDRKMEPDVVILRGEVRRPGPYSLRYPGEPISSIIERAGGLTALAFPEGTIFKRLTGEIIDDEHMKFAQVVQDDLYRQAAVDLRADLIRSGANPAALDLVDQSQQRASGTWGVSDSQLEDLTDFDSNDVQENVMMMVAKARATKNNQGFTTMSSRPTLRETTRIPIRLDLVLKKDVKAEDVPLRNGDTIYIPKFPNTVSVIGAVVNPSSVMFKDKANVKYYIDRVGGFQEQSAHARTLILRANGEVFPLRKVRKIERGDIVLVPPRPKLIRKKRFQETIQETLQVAQVLANFAVSYKVLIQDN
jgi:protein involved in polysaccharide export with SLBB domain